jgi:hypothetical protein
MGNINKNELIGNSFLNAVRKLNSGIRVTIRKVRVQIKRRSYTVPQLMPTSSRLSSGPVLLTNGGYLILSVPPSSSNAGE